MLRPNKYGWTVKVGSWSLTQWAKYLVVVAAVVVAANYIGGGSQRPALSSAITPVETLSDDRDFNGEVINVVDGDTLDALRDRTTVRIRLFGIDCPELKQAYGQEAKSFVVEIALHKTVTLKTHGKDKYGRTLADIIFDDGRVLSRELTKAGLAWWYQKYSTDAVLAELEQQARSNRLGLWADSNPMPPWDFRASHGR